MVGCARLEAGEKLEVVELLTRSGVLSASRAELPERVQMFR